MINFMLEEATSEYTSQVNQFNIRNNLLNLQGLSTADNPNITGKNVIGTGLPYIIELSNDLTTKQQGTFDFTGSWQRDIEEEE